MLTPAISLLSIGIWLSYLTIITRMTPPLRAIAERSGRRR